MFSSLCVRLAVWLFTVVSLVYVPIGLAQTSDQSDVSQSAEEPSANSDDFSWNSYFGNFFSDQLGGAINSGFDATGWSVIAGGAILTSIAYNNDDLVRRKFREERYLSDDAIKFGAVWGSGGPAIITALGLIAIDRPAGLALAESIAFTSATHYPMTLIARRGRPGKPDNLSAFPSGHTSNAFTFATSLAYSYGWTAAVPGFAAAFVTAAARIADDRHWLSDTVMGATIGYFWGRATSFQHHKSLKFSMVPQVSTKHIGLQVRYEF